jgi:hypothetical protein
MLKYRHTTLDDAPKIDEWIAADPAHADVMKSSDFILIPDEKTQELPKGRQCIEVQDAHGTIFYLAFRNALIVEAQFPPNILTAPVEQKVRLANGLKEALAYFMISSKKIGYYALLFNSVSESLIAFFEKLGFSKLKDYFKVDL